MQCPDALFFPVGAVLIAGDDVFPVLDPECVCKGAKCTLRADCPNAWRVFVQKAHDALKDSIAVTAAHKRRTLRMVCEHHPQVVVGQCVCDTRGATQWQDWCTMR